MQQQQQQQQPPPPAGVTKVDAALVNLRARLLDLHARASELRDQASMLRDGVGQGRSAAWPQFLDKYDTLAKLYSQVTDELDRAMTETGLDNLNALPCGVTEDPAALPDLLRTKLEPEVEREFKELEKGFVKGDTGGEVAKKIAAYNDFVEAFMDQFQDMRELLAAPRPKEGVVQPVPQNAEVVLQAMANGTGLK